MGKVTRVQDHLTPEEVRGKVKETMGFPRVLRWLVIWNSQVDPRPASEIALHLGLATQTVHNIVSKYNQFGPKALEGPGKGGRYKAYLTLEEEADFLEPFKKNAVSGQIATIVEIHNALEERVNHLVHKTTVYRMLKRNEWRKVVPRTVHVQSDEQKQEEFKKNSLKP